MTVRSPWRSLLYKYLATVTLDGKVIDLGGSRKSGYTENFQGIYELTVANMDVQVGEDIVLDLEQPFPIQNETYDHVLAINVLEHIYHYQNVIDETKRILKPGGSVIFAVPFLIQVHPSPHDHWRYTNETLERLFTEAGFSEVSVEPIGTGVFGSLAQLMYGMLKLSLLRYLVREIAFATDRFVGMFRISKNFSKRYYPLGYIVTVKK